MNCCGPRCGFCGRCDDEPRRSDDTPDFEFCDYQPCGRQIGLATSRISLQGVGVFCSKFCADTASVQHARRMQRSA